MRAALREDAPLGSTAKAATDYARYCEQAEQRLEKVSLMLQKGSEYQALQEAEEEPALLDLVGALSFGEEKRWQSFCETHALTVAPRLNARIVREVEALYGKGISANHPLYKDFRGAVLSRDDARSMRIVQTILKLNPTDENAKQELLRLENKRTQEAIEQLRAALKTDDEELIATLTETIKASAPPSKLERLEVYEQGEAVRSALRRRQARAALPGMVAEMQALQLQRDWRGVGARMEAMNDVINEHGRGIIDAATQTKLDAFDQFYQREKAADDKRRQFEKTLKSFVVFAEEVETRLLTGSGVTYDEIAEKDETFVRRWKELEAFQMPVPADVLQRIRTAGQELRAKLDRMHSAKRMRNLALAAMVVAFLLAVSAVGLHAWKAHTLTQELAGYRAKENCVPAEELIAKLRKEQGLLLQWPYLEAKIVEVDGWVTQARTTESQAREALKVLEDSFQDKKSTLPPAQLVRQTEDAAALVKQVAADLAPELNNRLAALKTRGDLQLDGSLKKLKSTASATLAKMEAEAEENLTYQKLAVKSAESLEGLHKRLVELEGLLKPEAGALQLPSDLEARIKTLRHRLDAFRSTLDEFKQIRELTAAATTLQAYKAALEKWQAVKFVEAAPAIRALDTLPTENTFLAGLVTGGDLDMLKAVLDDVSGPNMIPATPLDLDRQILLGLMTEANLNEVWENTLIAYGSRRGTSTVWSLGRPTTSIAGNLVRCTGKFYEPTESDTSAMFIKHEYSRVGDLGDYQGREVSSSRLSSTSGLMNALQFKGMTDENGERFFKSLMEVFERLAREKTGSPLAKAYLMSRMETMLTMRPQAWGLHLCPSLQADLQKLHTILGGASLRSDDWLVPAVRDRLLAPLTEYFKSCATRSYLKEARVRRDFLRAAATAGVKYAGYVETDLTVALTQIGRVAGELWLISKENGRPLLMANPSASQAATGEAVKISAAGAAPLSPVFFMPVDRKLLLQRYTDAASAAGSPAQPPQGDALLLTTP